jgi:two-component system sensor histidine kinase UhpB
VHQPFTPPPPSHDPKPWRDAAVVLAATVLSFALAARFDLNEALYAHTRRFEFLQFDELPIGALVLSLGLIWLSWRRVRHAQRELLARRAAESTLVGVLAENRRLAQEHLRIQEVERKHLARELHDQLGQYLNVIKLDAVSICERGADRQLALESARSIVHTVDHLHGAVSEMIGRLRPVGLDELGLVAAVEHCIDQWRARLPQTRFVFAVNGDFNALSEPLTLTLYRLVQEALTNIYKHADAHQAQILLERLGASRGQAEELRLAVADDGRGMDVSARNTRFGLSGMRERVELAGGRFILETAPGCGLKFEARLPSAGALG